MDICKINTQLISNSVSPKQGKAILIYRDHLYLFIGNKIMLNKMLDTSLHFLKPLIRLHYLDHFVSGCSIVASTLCLLWTQTYRYVCKINQCPVLPVLLRFVLSTNYKNILLQFIMLPIIHNTIFICTTFIHITTYSGGMCIALFILVDQPNPLVVARETLKWFVNLLPHCHLSFCSFSFRGKLCALQFFHSGLPITRFIRIWKSIRHGNVKYNIYISFQYINSQVTRQNSFLGSFVNIL